MGALSRLYLASRGGPLAGWRCKALLWTGLSLALLLKGPIGPMIVALTLAALCLWDRRVAWLKTLAWGWGAILVAAVVGPWAMAITVATDGDFWRAAVGGDLGPKLMGAQEGHGAPPLYYALLAPFMLFPAVLLLPAGLVAGWRARAETGVRFALCWLVPSWLVFELTPTKLVHYTLPLYGALAWLMARALMEPLGRVSRWAGAGVTLLGGLLFAVSGFLAMSSLRDFNGAPWAAVAAVLFLAAAGLGAWLLLKARAATAVAVAGTLALAAHGVLAGVFAPALRPLWLSSRAARCDAWSRHGGGLRRAEHGLPPGQQYRTGRRRRRRRGDRRRPPGNRRGPPRSGLSARARTRWRDGVAGGGGGRARLFEQSSRCPAHLPAVFGRAGFQRECPMKPQIEIVEVGPRDGLQNERAILDTTDKAEFVRRLESAGARRIEAVSFVNPRRVPQMAGAEEIMAALPREDGVSRIGLVLNERGWDRAIASGCDEANVVVCATDGFGIRNQGAGVAEQVATLAAIVHRQEIDGGPPISLTISVAFGCPFEGEVSTDQVVAIVREAARLGVKEIALADTIGVADPWTVRARIEAARTAAPDTRLRMHFHDTRGTGLANAFASVEAGVTVLDASCGGLGGCPFAPAATGNIATEDLAYMLHRAGFETGLDIDALVAAARWIGEKIGKAPVSALSRAGRFPA
jgi:hydroxymethylglutaryl-CoA lyase